MCFVLFGIFLTQGLFAINCTKQTSVVYESSILTIKNLNKSKNLYKRCRIDVPMDSRSTKNLKTVKTFVLVQTFINLHDNKHSLQHVRLESDWNKLKCFLFCFQTVIGDFWKLTFTLITNSTIHLGKLFNIEIAAWLHFDPHNGFFNLIQQPHTIGFSIYWQQCGISLAK